MKYIISSNPSCNSYIICTKHSKKLFCVKFNDNRYFFPSSKHLWGNCYWIPVYLHLLHIWHFFNWGAFCQKGAHQVDALFWKFAIFELLVVRNSAEFYCQDYILSPTSSWDELNNHWLHPHIELRIQNELHWLCSRGRGELLQRVTSMRALLLLLMPATWGAEIQQIIFSLMMRWPCRFYRALCCGSGRYTRFQFRC